jgi:hypothetical protein
MANGPSRKDRSVLFDYDAPVRATQEAIFAKESLAIAPILPIVSSALTSDGKSGNEPDAGGLVYDIWDNV